MDKNKYNDQGLSQMNARVSKEVCDSFNATIIRGLKKQHVYQAMARLWVSLPSDLRRSLVMAEADYKPGQKVEDLFVAAVKQIAESVYTNKMSEINNDKTNKDK